MNEKQASSFERGIKSAYCEGQCENITEKAETF